MRPARKTSGFTVVELLVVVGIISFLLALIGVVAVKARSKAREAKTKELLKKIHLALDAYKADNREYPPTSLEVFPSPEPLAGVDYDARWVADYVGGYNFEDGDKDPADKNFLMDAWKRRIRYRKISPTRMLVWSVGPDGINQIGTDAKRRERGSLIPADDLSNVEIDY